MNRNDRTPEPVIDRPVPPPPLVELVGSLSLDDYRRVGDEFVGHLRDLVGLTPQSRVLEVGCGSGRIAAPLLGYLDGHGSYDGFDVVDDAIAWCTEHLAPLHAQCRFHHVDVRNDVYNPGGALAATEFRFPFEDSTFDLVFLLSVFTHLLPEALTHYLEEIARVVRPDGQVLSTWLLLDDWSRVAATEHRSKVPLVPRFEPWWLADPARPEWAVAYDHRLVRAFHGDAGLAIDRVVLGTWSDRTDGVSFQDLVLASPAPPIEPPPARMVTVGEQYEIEPDFENPNGAAAKQLLLVGGNKRVLDFGCGFGYSARELAARGCVVTGIEVDELAAAKAREHCEQVIVGDLDVIDLPSSVDGARFDVALFGDVLEHLKDPTVVLQQVKGVLEPGGYVVASIPNVAHGAVRLALLKGAFEYRKLGLLDETHLHMFTRDSIEAMFREAGFAISEMQPVGVGLFATEIPLRREDFDPELVEHLEADPAAVTYQYVVKAVVGDASGVVEELRRRVEMQHAELEALRAIHTHDADRVDELTRWAEHLHGELAEAKRALDDERRGRGRFARTLAGRASRALKRRTPPSGT